MTTRDDLRGWLREAARRAATHLLVGYETFDWGDHPSLPRRGTQGDPPNVPASEFNAG